MLKMIFMDALILFLLVYAIMDILTRLAAYLSCRVTRQRKTDGYHVLYLTSGADAIEAAVRSEIQNAEQTHCSVILVDMNLSAEECAVAEKLCREYPLLTLLSREEYLRFVERQMMAAQS